MATFEHVEKLRERANVSYEEAKNALDHSGDDLLDAMIYLESMGKVAPPAGGGGTYSSKDAPHDAPPPPPEYKAEKPSGERFSDLVKRFFRFCGKLLQKGNSNSFEVWRNDAVTLTMPVTVLVLLLLFFWITVPLAIVGLFFGFRYYFTGPDFSGSGATVVNKAMDGAAHAADVLKEEIRAKEHQNSEKKDAESE